MRAGFGAFLLQKKRPMVLSKDSRLGTVMRMSTATGLSNEDLPNSPHARQLRTGFPWLTFDGELEAEFRLRNFDENLLYTRVNLCLASLIAIAFSAMDAMILGPELDRIPSRIQIFIIIPILLIGLAASFSPQRHRIHAPLTVCHHDHIWLERGGHSNHRLARRDLVADSLFDPQHRIHLFHERTDFLSRGRGECDRDAGLFCRRYRAGIAGPRVLLQRHGARRRQPVLCVGHLHA